MRRLLVTMISLAIILFPLAAGHAASAPVLKSTAEKVIKLPSFEDMPHGVEITAVRWANHIDAVTGLTKMRMVLDLTGPVTIDSAVVDMPVPQIVVNIKGAIPGKVAASYEFDGEVADQLTIQSVDSASTRLNLHLPLMVESSDYKVFMLPNDPAHNKPHRIVIDLNQKVPPIKFEFKPGLKNKTIVIDPGHGGSDSGAVGANQSQEKNLTMAIADRLRLLLEKAGTKVIMTRKNDRDVFGPNASAVDELKARATIANVNKADVFVSIHIDAFTNRVAGGTSTYYYQKTPYDAMLARSIQSFTAPAGGLQDRGARPANYYVIKRTNMPAVLTEIAFISNPAEEQLLNKPDFQQKMAQGIYDGLEKFFDQASRLGGKRS